jgi:hypothetical protein
MIGVRYCIARTCLVFLRDFVLDTGRALEMPNLLCKILSYLTKWMSVFSTTYIGARSETKKWFPLISM